MVTQVLCQIVLQQFPIQVKKMTKEETKKYHLKKLYELSLKNKELKPMIDESNYDQRVWVLRRLKDPPDLWQRWFVDLHFTQEKKEVMGLIDEDISIKGSE